MPLGVDQQYDETWVEQDKIRRRMELKQRVKLEGINNNFNPFKHMRVEVFRDPAIERYMDLRKQGRMPNAPFRPLYFWSMFGTIFAPMYIMYKILEWERGDFEKGCADGTIPYEKRIGRHIS